MAKLKDVDIERVLDAMIPELRESLKTVILENHLIDVFQCALATHSATGTKQRYFCFIAHECPAAVLEGAMNGIGESMKRQMAIAADYARKVS